MRLLITDLQPGQAYSLQARSVIEGEKSDWSLSTDFIAQEYEVLPNIPTGVSWTVSGDSFQGSWDAVTTNVDGDTVPIVRYEVELVGGGSTIYKSVPQTTESEILWNFAFEDNRASFGGSPKPSITIRVRAVDNRDLKSDWSSPASATNPAPGPVTALVATGVLDGVDLSWTPPTDEDLIGYNVYVGSTVGFTPSGANKIFFGNATRWTFTSTTYSLQYFKVRAVDKFNQESTDTTASATPGSPFGSDTTPPATPTGLAGTITTSGDASFTYMDVSWTANSEGDLAGYKVKYRKTADSVWTTVDVGRDATNVRISPLSPFTNYDVIIAAYDESNNISAYTSPNTTVTGATNSAPSTPAAPGAASNTLQIQVTPTGNKAAGGAMEADVEFYEVYASTTTGFTPSSSNQIGVIAVGPSMSVTFSIPASGGGSTETWFVKVIAVDSGGLKSSASAQTSASPTLIANTNIVNATITSAKIHDLNADLITAGSGLINSLIVKSTLTLGDASNNGIVQSFDYVAGTTGFKLEKSNLEINSGTIRAAALALQIGSNIVTPPYADFEATSRYYPSSWPVSSGTSFTAALDATSKKYGTRSLKIVNSSGASRSVYMGSTTTDYNVAVEPSTRYILSVWISSTGASVSGFGFIKQQDGTVVNGTSGTIAATAAYTRYSWVVTTTSAATSLEVGFTASGNCTLFLDGWQLERSVNATNTTPSPYTAPSATSVIGGQITTGSIESSQVGTVWDSTANSYVTDPSGQPSWIIDTQGDAKFGNLNVVGKVVVGASTEPATALSTMASFNYIPGSTGYILRSDGYAEFRQMASDSIHADAIITGTLTADMISSGTINSDISITGSIKVADVVGSAVAITTKQLTSNVAFLTASTAHGFATGDTVLVTGVDATFNGTYAVTGTPSDVQFSYDLTASNVGSTSATGSAVKVTSKRSIVMDTSGINLIEADGVTISASLPTDSSKSLFFSGKIQTASITVSDNLLLQGTNSVLTTASVLTLAASTMPPAGAPNIVHNWNNFNIWFDVPSDFSAGQFGLAFDGTNYYVLNQFFGSGAIGYGASSGAFVANSSLAGSANIVNPFGGLVKISTNWYYLGFNNVNNRWEVVKFANSGTGFSTISTTWIYNNQAAFGASATEWRGPAGGVDGLKYPSLGTDGSGNLLIARCKSNGTILIQKFDTTASNGSPLNLLSTVTTNVTDEQHIASVQFGSFDFGGSRYVVTTRGSAARSSRNYVFGSTGLQNNSETWLSANNLMMTGCQWDGSAFASLGVNGKHYQYTSLSNQVGVGTWSIKQTWYDADQSSLSVTNRVADGTTATLTVGAAHNFNVGDEVIVSGYTSSDVLFNGTYTLTAVGSTTISYLKAATVSTGAGSGTPLAKTDVHETVQSTAFAFTAIRRARLNITSTAIPDSGRRNDPDSVRFYISTSGGSYYLQSALAPGITTLTLTGAPLSASTSTGASVFPDGVPAKFVSSNGKLELSAAGTAIFGSTTDVNTNAGNTPALRIGNITGQHLRVDGNEIQSMTSDTTNDVGSLSLQAGGGTIGMAGATLINLPQGNGGGIFGLSGINAAQQTLTIAGGGGEDTVTHGLGGTPTFVAITGLATGANTYRFAWTASSSTTFTVRAINSSTNAVAPNGTTIGIRWFAIR